MPAAIPFIVQALVTAAVTAVVSKLLAPSAPDGRQNAQADAGGRVQLSPATNNKLPVWYGSSWASPIVIDGKISSDNQYMWYVMAIGEVTDTGSICFDESNGTGTPIMYWGDKRLTFDPTNKYKVTSWKADNDAESARVSLADGDFHVYFYNNGSSSPLYGAPSAVSVLSDASTGGGIPEAQRWTSTDTMYKTSFCIVRMKYNSDKNITNIEQATIKVTNTLTSPGAVLYDYMTNSRYGCGIATTQIDKTTFDALDAYSAQTITYTNSSNQTATQARYKINGPIDTTKDNYNNIQEVCKSCDSWLQWNEATGKWSIIANRPYGALGLAKSDLFHANDDNIIGAISVVPSNLDSAFRKAEVQFPSILIKDQFDTAYIEMDQVIGGKSQWNSNHPDMRYSTKFELVNDSVQAQYLATRKILQSREDLTIEFNLDYSAIQIDAGDVIRVTHSWYEWDEKLFRVFRVDEVLDQDGKLSVVVAANEYNDTIYADGALKAFAPSPNTGMTNPNIIGKPTAPTITDSNPTAAIPSFQVNCVSPSIGRVLGLEFWYSTSTSSAISGNNYLLKEVQHYSSGSIYPNATGESIVVSGFKPGNYWWRVRAVGSVAKSEFSDPSYFAWAPNPTTAVVGQTFQAIFAPNILAVPRTGSPLTPSFTNITPTLHGLVGGGSVAFSTASTDTAMSNNTWRIGASSTTGGTGAIVYSNITFATPTTGATSVTWAAPTAMASSPAYITVPVRYKDNTGTVYQSAPAQIQIAFLDQGTKGVDGLNGSTPVSPTVYFNSVIGQSVSISGGSWNLATGTWSTRPTTVSNGVAVVNTDTPSSITSGSYRYVARAVPQYTTNNTGSIAVSWGTPAIDAGFGPAGNDGKSPVDISLSGGGAFYRNSIGEYSPQSLTIQVTIQNYPAPVPIPSWTVVGGSPSSASGSSITITPTSSTNIQVTCQVGAYVKTLTVPVVSQGPQGIQGTAGSQGAQGNRGFTPLAYIAYNGDPTLASVSQLTTAWQTTTNYVPIAGDGGAFYGVDTQGNNKTRVARYNGSTWVDFSTFIPGDLLVEQSITSAQLNVDDIYALNISSTSMATGGNFGDVLQTSNVFCRGFDNGSRTFAVECSGTPDISVGDTVFFSTTFSPNQIGYSVISFYQVSGNDYSITVNSPVSLPARYFGFLYKEKPGYWLRGSDGSAGFTGNVYIGSNLYISGIISEGKLSDRSVSSRNLEDGITSINLVTGVTSVSNPNSDVSSYSAITTQTDLTTTTALQYPLYVKPLATINLVTPDWWYYQSPPQNALFNGPYTKVVNGEEYLTKNGVLADSKLPVVAFTAVFDKIYETVVYQQTSFTINTKLAFMAIPDKLSVRTGSRWRPEIYSHPQSSDLVFAGPWVSTSSRDNHPQYGAPTFDDLGIGTGAESRTVSYTSTGYTATTNNRVFTQTPSTSMYQNIYYTAYAGTVAGEVLYKRAKNVTVSLVLAQWNTNGLTPAEMYARQKYTMSTPTITATKMA